MVLLENDRAVQQSRALERSEAELLDLAPPADCGPPTAGSARPPGIEAASIGEQPAHGEVIAGPSGTQLRVVRGWWRRIRGCWQYSILNSILNTFKCQAQYIQMSSLQQSILNTQYSIHSNVKLFSKAFITTQVNTCTHAIMTNA